MGPTRPDGANGPLDRNWLLSLRRSELDAIRRMLFVNVVLHYAVGFMLGAASLSWVWGMGSALLRALATRE